MGNRASNIFIDLIYDASTQYPIWNPHQQIQVGDYGVRNKRTGVFQAKGRLSDLIGAQYAPPQMSDQPGRRFITSENATEITLSEEFRADPRVASARVRGSWTFNSKNGALLALYDTQTTTINPYIDVQDLVQNRQELKGMCVVTEVITCRAVARYFTRSKDRTFSLAVDLNAPVGATGVTVGGGGDLKYVTSYTGGDYLEAYAEAEQQPLTALYTLVSAR